MKPFVCLALALCVPPQAFAQQPQTSSPDRQAFAREVQAYSRLFRLPGISIAVVPNGHLDPATLN